VDVAPLAGTDAACGATADVKEILNIGCGRKPMKDALNLDVSAEVGADVVHDLTKVPWPLPSSRFREVFAFDVIEHLPDIVPVMEEIHRVCQPGARVHITVPHFSSANAFTDPTHRHQFSCFSFDYFGHDHELSFYSRARFRRARAQIVFHPTLVNKLVHRIANSWPVAYERRWAWIFPAWFLSIDLEAEK
jgi:SAM-dependent methyltransferase